MQKRKRMIYIINAESTITEVNAGMKTVDISWDIFLKKNHIQIPYKRFSIKPHKHTIKITDKLTLQYQGSLNFDLKMLKKEDILIFWGDFLHAHHYLKNDLFRITKEKIDKPKKYIPKFLQNKKLYDYNENSYLHSSYRFYLLKNVKKWHWGKTISFGTTLVGDDHFNIMKQENYCEAFTYFIKNIDRIWTRDMYSALQISHIRKEYSHSYLGIDAALLIGPDDYDTFLDKPSINLPDADHILTHFIRTKAPIDQLLSLADNLAKELEMPLYWLPWLRQLDDKRFHIQTPTLKDSILQLEAKTYSDLIHSIRNASLLITDTYHLALIAWRLKVPVLCIGSGLQHPYSTVDDKKKEIFYTMYNMLPFYFYAEELDDPEKVSTYIKMIKNEFTDQKRIMEIIHTIETHAEIIEQDLAKYLQ